MTLTDDAAGRTIAAGELGDLPVVMPAGEARGLVFLVGPRRLEP